MSLFKDRVVAMGKPHCNYSICNFRSCTRFKVNFAYAEFHSWLLISMDSPLSRGMTEPGRFAPRALVTFTSRHRHLRVCGGPVFLLPAHFDSVSLLLLPSVKFRALPWQCFCLITVAHASGSERSVLFPWLFLLLFRGSASASSSASFREIPC